MKYYSIKVNPHYEDDLGPTSRANGANVPNGEQYFSQMRRFFNERTIFRDAPMFDYFFLENGSKPENWEWKLQDIHDFTGESPDGWLVSDKFKKVIEQFNIIPNYHFYQSKLLYKGGELDYWVFQWGVREFSNFDYVASIFYEEGTDEIGRGVTSFDDFMDYRKSLEEDVVFKKLVLKEPYDFVVGHRLGLDLYMSEKLKTVIETEGIEGFLFEAINFEIVCE